jgi:hypothetical protein
MTGRTGKPPPGIFGVICGLCLQRFTVCGKNWGFPREMLAIPNCHSGKLEVTDMPVDSLIRVVAGIYEKKEEKTKFCCSDRD